MYTHRNQAKRILANTLAITAALIALTTTAQAQGKSGGTATPPGTPRVDPGKPAGTPSRGTGKPAGTPGWGPRGNESNVSGLNNNHGWDNKGGKSGIVAGAQAVAPSRTEAINAFASGMPVSVAVGRSYVPVTVPTQLGNSLKTLFTARSNTPQLNVAGGAILSDLVANGLPGAIAGPLVSSSATYAINSTAGTRGAALYALNDAINYSLTNRNAPPASLLALSVLLHGQ